MQDFSASVHVSLKETWAPAAERFRTAASVFTVETAGGITAAGAQLHLEDPTLRIATVIASNSGRPGGACRDDITGDVCRGKIHGHHSTQEEDCVSNWLITASESWDERSRHFARISGSFGLRSPAGTDTATIQGIDYTTTRRMGARMYADAWCCQGARLSDKRVTGPAAARFDTKRTYPTTLVFCAGPNAQEPGRASASSSMRRTFSQRAHDELSFLEAGAAWAVYAALHASAACGCDAVLLPFVSGGLYAGPWRSEPDLRRRFTDNIERMLRTGELPDGTACAPLGKCFRGVVLVVLPPP